MLDLKEEYKRLAAHGNGLPRGNQIFCPVFTQDKWEYLKLIATFINPTLQIPVQEEYLPCEWEQIEAFWNLYCSSLSGGVIKAPFTTNRNWLTYPKRLKRAICCVSVEGVLKKAFNELDGYIPYVLMQPCIDTSLKREMKVVFLGGKASHITTGFSVITGAFPFSNEEVMEFAQNAYDALIAHLGPNNWLDQLCRVDVMYNEFEKRMVVNEFESLQACFSMKSHYASELDFKVEAFLKDYYIKDLNILVINKLNSELSEEQQQEIK